MVILQKKPTSVYEKYRLNPLEFKGNYSATWKNMKLVHWPLMGGLSHLVGLQSGGDWTGP